MLLRREAHPTHAEFPHPISLVLMAGDWKNINQRIHLIFNIKIHYLPTCHLNVILLVLLDLVRRLLDHPLEVGEGIAEAGTTARQGADVDA